VAMHMYLHGFPLSLSLCRVPQGGCPCRGPKRSVIWRRRTIGLRDVFPVLRGDNYRTVTPRRCPAVAPLSLTATSRYRPACDRSDTGPERAGKGRADGRAEAAASSRQHSTIQTILGCHTAGKLFQKRESASPSPTNELQVRYTDPQTIFGRSRVPFPKESGIALPTNE